VSGRTETRYRVDDELRRLLASAPFSYAVLGGQWAVVAVDGSRELIRHPAGAMAWVLVADGVVFEVELLEGQRALDAWVEHGRGE